MLLSNHLEFENSFIDVKMSGLFKFSSDLTKSVTLRVFPWLPVWIKIIFLFIFAELIRFCKTVLFLICNNDKSKEVPRDVKNLNLRRRPVKIKKDTRNIRRGFRSANSNAFKSSTLKFVKTSSRSTTMFLHSRFCASLIKIVVMLTQIFFENHQERLAIALMVPADLQVDETVIKKHP